MDIGEIVAGEGVPFGGLLGGGRGCGADERGGCQPAPVRLLEVAAPFGHEGGICVRKVGGEGAVEGTGAF